MSESRFAAAHLVTAAKSIIRCARARAGIIFTSLYRLFSHSHSLLHWTFIQSYVRDSCAYMYVCVPIYPGTQPSADASERARAEMKSDGCTYIHIQAGVARARPDLSSTRGRAESRFDGSPLKKASAPRYRPSLSRALLPHSLSPSISRPASICR